MVCLSSGKRKEIVREGQFNKSMTEVEFLEEIRELTVNRNTHRELIPEETMGSLGLLSPGVWLEATPKNLLDESDLGRFPAGSSLPASYGSNTWHHMDSCL